MAIKIVDEVFDPWLEIQSYQNTAAMTDQFGATCIFIGTMRDFNEGDHVKGMSLEHYPGMTERQLEKIVVEAQSRWPIINTLLIHRVGDISPNEPIVLVAIWSSHRGDAYDANRYIMEALKSRAPFWKKEVLTSELERWVLKNTDGYKVN